MSDDAVVWAVLAVIWFAGFIIMSVIGRSALNHWGETIEEYGELVDDYSKATHDLLDATILYGAALQVAADATELVKYSERSVESFYGNTAAPTTHEQALARVFEVERNQAIQNTRRSLIALAQTIKDIGEKDSEETTDV